MTDINSLEQQLADAQLEIAQLKAQSTQQKKKKIEIKVSEKGCVQINGIRKFPITFYKNELETIFNIKEELQQFMMNNTESLKSK